MEQADRVRVRRRREEILGRRGLDDIARVHHVDPLGHAGDDAEVVGDEDQCRAGVRRQAPQQLEHLGLDRDVEGGRRLVGDHQLRLEGQGHRDHDPLAHPAGELVGIVTQPALGPRDADHPEQLRGTHAGVCDADLLVRPDRLDHLLLDPEDGVEAGHRVLEDHRDVAAADLPHVALRQRREIEPVEHDGSALDPAGRLRQQPHDREVRHALAAARLADEPEPLAGLHLERHAVDGVDRSLVRAEPDDEVIDREEGHQRFNRGSSDSRRPSPSRLKPIALSEIAAPVKKMIHGAWR